MKLQLGHRAKRLSGEVRETWPHAHDGGGVTVLLAQRLDRGSEVVYKFVTVELELTEAEKLAADLLEGVREERHRQYQEERAAIPKIDHKCHHCGHEWHGFPDDRCPRVHAAPHPAYPYKLTPQELAMLVNAQEWLTGNESWDRVRTEAYDRNVLNALIERGLIEFCDDDKATWRPNSVGQFIVKEAKAGRTSVAETAPRGE
jgi:hypothetical protein